MVLMTKQVVGQRVVTGIADQEDIITTDGTLDQTLCVTVLETGTVALQQESILVDANFLGPLDQMTVDFCSQILGARAGDQSKLEGFSSLLGIMSFLLCQ